MSTIRLSTALLFTLFNLNSSIAQGAFGALRGLISSEARILSYTSSMSRIGEGASIYSGGVNNSLRVISYADEMYSGMGKSSIILNDLPKKRWENVHLEDEHLFTITSNPDARLRYEAFFHVEYFKSLFDRTAASWKKNKLNKADSVFLCMAILNAMPEIMSQHQLSSTGGNGIIPPRNPFVYDGFEDYRRMKNMTDILHEEPEYPDMPDDSEGTDYDLPDDSTEYERPKTEGNTKKIISPSTEGLQPSNSGSHWVRWAVLLLYWLLSSLGISRIFLKARVSRSTAYIPFWRLGQLFHVCGYQNRHAFSLLVPVFNIYYWWQVNNRLCKSFQYPSSLTVLGFLIPGFLWYLIGYSNKYYVGHKRF